MRYEHIYILSESLGKLEPNFYLAAIFGKPDTPPTDLLANLELWMKRTGVIFWKTQNFRLRRIFMLINQMKLVTCLKFSRERTSSWIAPPPESEMGSWLSPWIDSNSIRHCSVQCIHNNIQIFKNITIKMAWLTESKISTINIQTGWFFGIFFSKILCLEDVVFWLTPLPPCPHLSTFALPPSPSWWTSFMNGPSHILDNLDIV